MAWTSLFTRWRLWAPVAAPIAALVGAAILGASYLAYDVARAQDRANLVRERQLLTRALQGMQDRAGDWAVEYGHWDDAYEHLAQRFDSAWARRNFFPTAFDHIAVATRAGEIVFEQSSPQLSAAPAGAYSAADLLGGARALRWTEGAASAIAARSPTLSGFDISSHGAPSIVAIAAIRPTTEPPDPAYERYALVFEALTQERLTDLAHDVGVEALRFAIADAAAAGSDQARIDLMGVDGGRIGAIIWSPARPGAAALAARLPWLIVAFFLLGAAAIAVTIYLVRARLQSAELAREAAESANVAKSQFLANMTHELRTPLNAILGYAELLSEDAQDDRDDHRLADLIRIQDSGRRLLSMINDVLDLSRIEAGRVEVTIEDFSIAYFLEEIASVARPQIEAGRNRFTLHIEAGLERMASDERIVRQILLQLLSNAGKFTQSGEVSLSVRRDGEALIAFVVADTGIRMDAAQAKRLFEPFQQAQSALDRSHDGAGLGLALADRLAMLIGGGVRVESAPETGSTFTLLVADRKEALANASSAVTPLSKR